MATLPDWVANAPRYVCQVCGGPHDEISHAPLTSLLDAEPEDPRISRAEDIRDGYDSTDDGREVW